MIADANNYSNPRYWFDNLQPNRRGKHKIKLVELIDKFSDNLKAIIRTTIVNECVKINRLLQTNCVTINYSSIGLVINSNKNTLTSMQRCIVTGLDISMQQERSSHLSHSGLYYYLRNDKSIFEKMRLQFLSHKWMDASLKTQIKEIAHNIRNASSNQRIKQKKLYPQGQTNLFNIKSQKDCRD